MPARLHATLCLLAAASLGAAAAVPAAAVIHPKTSVRVAAPIPGRVKVAVLSLQVPRGARPPRLRLVGAVPAAKALVIGLARRGPTRFTGLVALAAFRAPSAAALGGAGVTIVSSVPFTTLANGDPTVMAKPLAARLRPLLGSPFALIRATPAAPAPGLTGKDLLKGVVGLVRGRPSAAFTAALAGTTGPTTPGPTPTTPTTPTTTPTTPGSGPLVPPALPAMVAPGTVPGLPGFALLQDSTSADAQILRVIDQKGVPTCLTSGAGGPGRHANSILQDAQDPLSALSSDDLLARFQKALGSASCLVLQGFEQNYADAVKGAIDQGAATPVGRLLEAMTRAQQVTLADGSTLASHVHFELGPTIPSAIGAGLGPNHDLGLDGKSHFNTYMTLMAAGARSAGVHLQMFHGVSFPNDGPFSVEEWLRVPPAVLDVFQRAGGDPGRLHFTITAVPTMPVGDLPPGLAGDTMQAQFGLARQPGAALTIFANGVGGLNVDPHAAEFVRELQAGFPALVS